MQAARTVYVYYQAAGCAALNGSSLQSVLRKCIFEECFFLARRKDESVGILSSCRDSRALRARVIESVILERIWTRCGVLYFVLLSRTFGGQWFQFSEKFG